MATKDNIKEARGAFELIRQYIRSIEAYFHLMGIKESPNPEEKARYEKFMDGHSGARTYARIGLGAIKEILDKREEYTTHSGLLEKLAEQIEPIVEHFKTLELMEKLQLKMTEDFFVCEESVKDVFISLGMHPAGQ